MKYIRIAATAVCALILSAALTGSESALVFRNGIDTGAAMRSHKPDVVMVSSGEFAVTWGEFYFLLHDTAAQLTGGFAVAFDWDEPAPDGGGNWADLLKNYITDQAVSSLIYKYGLAAYDVSLGDEEIETLRTLIDDRVSEAGSVEALERELNEGGIYNLSVFEQLLTNFFLQDMLPAALYGETYDNLPDEAVEAFAQQNGFMRAKHILISFLSEYDGYAPQEIEEAKLSAAVLLEGILDELSVIDNADALNERFDELIREHSEDPGSFSFPNGYLFEPRDMVAEFSNACMELDFYELSGIVETSYGYHVILRLPLDYDYIVPISLVNSDSYYSLRQLAVFDDYDRKLSGWYEAMTIRYSPELEALDIGYLFRWQD